MLDLFNLWLFLNMCKTNGIYYKMKKSFDAIYCDNHSYVMLIFILNYCFSCIKKIRKEKLLLRTVVLMIIFNYLILDLNLVPWY